MVQGFMYLVAVMDGWSRYGLAGELSNSLDREFCIRAGTSAVAGAFKDAAEASGAEFRVEAPILNRHDFEHLEAEGWGDSGPAAESEPSETS